MQFPNAVHDRYVEGATTGGVHTVVDRRVGGVVHKRSWVAAAVLVAAGCAFALPSQSAKLACSEAGAPAGGDWPIQGHDTSNTHNQRAEHDLGPDKAATLEPVWSFDTGHFSGIVSGNLGDINSIVTVARGCVFVATAQPTSLAGTVPGDTTAPDVFALDANTGNVLWKAVLPADPPGLGGAIIGSPTIVGDRALVIVNQGADGKTKGPHVASLDIHTGKPHWISKPFTTADGDYSMATATIYKDTIVAGWSGHEGDPRSHGGAALLDLASGRILATEFSVPKKDWGTAAEPKYAGGGVWTTPAVDQDTGYVYYGVGNPYSKDIEHPRTNAILKLDANRSRKTFGTVVGFTHGNIDQNTQLLYAASRPTCNLAPNVDLHDYPLGPLQNVAANSFTCLQLDLGFGASANLFRGPNGHLLAGALQKSGTYHVVDTTTMKEVWQSVVGLPCEVCNGSSTAYDPQRKLIIANEGPANAIVAFSSVDGKELWRAPVGDPVHYQPVTIADGVVYTVDFYGNLRAWNEDNGLPVLVRPMLVDGGLDAMSYGSSGVTIARHMVFAAAGSHVVAYRPAS